jgi:carboxypeptidase Q
MLSPIARTLHLESLGWSPSTPAGGVKGEVVVVEDLAPETLKAQAEKFKGKIVLLNLSKILAHGWVKVLPDLERADTLSFRSRTRRRNLR